MDLRYHFQNQILRQSAHGRPVLDIRAKMDLHTRICHTVAVKYAILVDLAVEEIFRITEFHIQIRCCCQITFIGCGCCDGSGIHQCHRCDLSILKLGTFPVREVSGRMADTESIIGRSIPGAEARTTKCCL